MSKVMSDISIAGLSIAIALYYGFSLLKQSLNYIFEELRKIRKLLEQLKEQKKTTIDFKKK
ncbi:hypothetical protein [Dysgonomonas sp. HGC4]|uniref:hypothetical protein n=1 Tax=Dysgonomonas sp. HGC4 TaxID=1658009 RepID=UPI00067FD44D|nr:hypothetical protein [Dysgonomonas sp. HGC4]MBD8349374.1 hypothetical protein [Dysgonomonas sp. HGC4]